MSFRFGTKAETLSRLGPHLRLPRMCEQEVVEVGAWQRDRRALAARIAARFEGRALVVRSSARREDGWHDSMAGAHLSLLGVAAEPDPVAAAVDRVIASYGETEPGDQVLVQPRVEAVAISGVVLTRSLDAGAPYYVVNYDDLSGRTDTVTGGAESKELRIRRSRAGGLRSGRFRRLLAVVGEIEAATGSDSLDIEFCIDRADQVYVLQVRPLAARRRWRGPADAVVEAALDAVGADIEARMRPVPGLAGRTTLFGDMPDWNPAEMIGTTPRPLALSLYRRLITDGVWARARHLMGYRNLGGRPLMAVFRGRPFIDVRLSFNSFLPAGLDEALAGRLVDHQIERLAADRSLHDKVEFAVATTCRDLDFARAAAAYRAAGFTAAETEALGTALGRLTAQALGAYPAGISALLAQAETPPPASPAGADGRGRAARLLDSCRADGTLPFSILARHAFIGTALLRSLVARGALGPAAAEHFLGSIETVAGELVRDMAALAPERRSRAEFLARYGHLRPGTYDICSPRYDERPELYLGAATRAPAPAATFAPGSRTTAAIDRLLAEAGYACDARHLFGYIRAAVAAREAAKFAFTRGLSDALAALAEWGEGRGLDRETLSFLTIEQVLATDDAGELRACAAAAREAQVLTRAIALPHLIAEPADVDVVRLPLGRPNFITDRKASGPIRLLGPGEAPDIDDHIVLVESADPGFDWIFSHRLAGLVTKFGGANSHMTIRCAEFDLPAAIGCGERLFETLRAGTVVEIDAGARQVRVVR